MAKNRPYLYEECYVHIEEKKAGKKKTSRCTYTLLNSLRIACSH
jgi:hypothetical protein